MTFQPAAAANLALIINPHQRRQCSDSPFARIHYFHTAGSRNGLEGVGRQVTVTQRKLYLRKKHVFVTEKSIEGARQDEKHVPHLLEAIMRPTDPVKEGSRPILMKMT